MKMPLEELNLSLTKESMLWKSVVNVMCQHFDVNKELFLEELDKLRKELNDKEVFEHRKFLNRNIFKILRNIQDGRE